MADLSGKVMWFVADLTSEPLRYNKRSLGARIWRAWPRLAARMLQRRSYALSDSPTRRVTGQPLLHWIRFGRVGASHFLLSADPAWRRVLHNHGRRRG